MFVPGGMVRGATLPAAQRTHAHGGRRLQTTVERAVEWKADAIGAQGAVALDIVDQLVAAAGVPGWLLLTHSQQ